MEEQSPSSKTDITLWQEIRRNFSSLKPVWPFFGLLTLAMAVMYVLALSNVPALRQPWMLIVFTLMMLAHTGLHWLSPVASATHSRSAVYLVVQIALVLALITLTHYEMLIYGLFIGLIGETLGLVRPLKRSFAVILGLTAAMFVARGLYFSWVGIFPFMITILPLIFFVVIYVYLFTRQLEEKKRAEDLLEDLEIAHQQLSEYAVRIEALTLTNERQRMARELHDTLAQGLAGIILQLEAASEHQEQGHNEKAAAIVKQTIMRARSTLADARQVIDDLREEPSANISLADFVHDEAERFTSLTGLPCEVMLGQDLPVSEEVKLQLEKIISEGLTNIARHAHANRCWVHLEIDDEQLQLEIGDDGQGFLPENTAANSGHYGLVGMRERIHLLNGKLTIESVPGTGTRLLISLPVSGEEGK
jgi:NarL family two-component system sensor histidine kinase YdfH